ncbi:uncharacterized protein BJ171DRAFT_497171 [Polychytrium aggregatum]|uniref:uncharacterized protein n=1 Tax=Polychytrium aggregatum TaxID=110093 RepID=UPI0022FEA8AF|nr:uncharacterized protein BJ171DRAFT_497171 [Polychytrium aggregatum]KAI9206283.1 hypothetical protein BJ171DRAFT_497171 [Polychytrium aggregatum]
MQRICLPCDLSAVPLCSALRPGRVQLRPGMSSSSLCPECWMRAGFWSWTTNSNDAHRRAHPVDPHHTSEPTSTIIQPNQAVWPQPPPLPHTLTSSGLPVPEPQSAGLLSFANRLPPNQSSLGRTGRCRASDPVFQEPCFHPPPQSMPDNR